MFIDFFAINGLMYATRYFSSVFKNSKEKRKLNDLGTSSRTIFEGSGVPKKAEDSGCADAMDVLFARFSVKINGQEVMETTISLNSPFQTTLKSAQYKNQSKNSSSFSPDVSYFQPN